MTMIYNSPADFTEDATRGFVELYSDRLRPVPGGVVRRRRPADPKVAVIYGGGSGHYPAFAGLVGPGMGDGAVIGNLFTSPSTAQAYSVARAASSGGGVVISYGNYAGDVMNFGIAGERLTAEGIETRQLIITDDIASAPAEEAAKRRGIAGDFVVFKVLGAAAERGDDLDEVVRLGLRANAATFSLGVAFAGCTFPGAREPHFTVPEGKLGIGLGIHGEPGLEDIDWMPADELAALLVERLLTERPAGSGPRVAAILNGLGSTKYEELFLLWGHVAALLREADLEIVAPEVGELVTSLDMAGVSLTLCWLDEELEPLWLAPAHTPAFRRGVLEGTAAPTTADEASIEGFNAEAESPVGSAASRAVAALVLDCLRAMQAVLHDQEVELGRVDQVAGDGDHGRGMVRGIDCAVDAAAAALETGWGAAGVLARAGDAWAEHAGGTSGVLWGAALRALGAGLGNEDAAAPADVAAAVEQFVLAMTDLGKAELGDKTIIDAAVPFRDRLRLEVDAQASLGEAWSAASAEACRAAEATSALSPRKGRARPLAERSIGHPDPGAVSFGMCVAAVGRILGAAGGDA
ncbi:dihydroxyacetone kinase family protein [Actinomyces procaprae]|uniref:dihydroxyacetone kinase family protein n=1 Tax=Actinomyces procaprae TaxID=2560010 RepID=UPI00109DE7F4|nr:dihydroxyacetone kinase family protein [Actinomyces procaprae]